MYERFTDRARKAMQLANQEAQRFNHEYIGTEHILLGLVQEGSGVGANVLKNLNVELRTIRREVEKIVMAGPDMVTMGKLPQTPRAKKVIEYAIQEATNLNHNYVGTEHLLLGLIREEEGVAAQVLMNLGLELDTLRDAVMNLLGDSSPPDAAFKRLPEPRKDDLPDDVRKAVTPLDVEIARLRAEKEVAVTNDDFEKAAQLRDQEDKLKKQRQEIIQRAQVAPPKVVREYEVLIAPQDKPGNSVSPDVLAAVRKRLHERFEGVLEARIRVDGKWHVGAAVFQGELASFRVFANLIDQPRDFFQRLKTEIARDFSATHIAIIERPVEVL